MRSRRSSTAKRIVRGLRNAMFVESRQGRAAEIAAWSNAAGALAVAAAVTALAWSRMHGDALWVALAAGALTFLLLRLALTHRGTVWIASVIGTFTVAALGGSLAWVFSHVIELVWVPPVAGLLGALLAAIAPAWSYAKLARRRAESIRDSLIPVSAPHSH